MTVLFFIVPGWSTLDNGFIVRPRTNNEPIVRPRANNTHCPGVRGPRTTQIALDSIYSILFAQLCECVLLKLTCDSTSIVVAA